MKKGTTLRMGGPEASRAPRAVTFEAIGTLIDCPERAEIVRAGLERHGCGRTDAERVAVALRDAWREVECTTDPRRCRFGAHPDGELGFWGDVLRRVAALLGLAEPSRFAVAELFAAFGRADSWEVRPGVRELLAELDARGIATGVVSNWDRRLPALLRELGLAPPLGPIVVSADIGCEKPHPEPFRRCAARLGLAPERILHVGHRRVEDVEGAGAIGMATIELRTPAPGDTPSAREWAEVLERVRGAAS